jgi:ubiquinone/menaquinone biosynthesis C-methylase UbiE
MLLARHNYEVERIDTLLDGVSVERSLEIGCGYGRLSVIFGRHSLQHIGIDINEEALSMARMSYPRIDFRLERAEALPFENDAFGLICTWTVLQHIPDDRLPAVAREISRVLGPGGILLMCEETRSPGVEIGHTWHRTVQSYDEMFATLTLHHHSEIDQLNRIPGMESPGEVMMFVSEGAGSAFGVTDQSIG